MHLGFNFRFNALLRACFLDQILSLSSTPLAELAGVAGKLIKKLDTSLQVSLKVKNTNGPCFNNLGMYLSYQELAAHVKVHREIFGFKIIS